VRDTIGSDAVGGGRTRVLHLISSKGLYGAERVVLALCRQADPGGFEAVLGIFRKEGARGDEFLREAEGLGIAMEIIRYTTAFDIGQLSNLFTVVRRHRPQLIHTHEYKTNILGFCVAKILGIPIVSTVHALHKLKGRAKRELQFSVWLLRYFMAVMPVSGEVHDELEALGVPAEKMVTIRNVPPLTEKTLAGGSASLREELGISPHRRLIGFLGRLIPAKGCDLLIRAVARIDGAHRDFVLVVVGEGPERESLETLAKSLGVGQTIRFCGFRTDPEHVYASLDLLVLPSREEGTPLVMLEGMWQEVPVIATAVGGIPEVIEHRANGILVPSEDPAALAAAIIESLEKPDEARKRALEAKKRITLEYDVKTWAKKVHDVYAGLVR
jgi:glycosyltransferase involved in cell wall biosynthesis